MERFNAFTMLADVPIRKSVAENVSGSCFIVKRLLLHHGRSDLFGESFRLSDVMVGNYLEWLQVFKNVIIVIGQFSGNPLSPSCEVTYLMARTR